MIRPSTVLERSHLVDGDHGMPVLIMARDHAPDAQGSIADGFPDIMDRSIDSADPPATRMGYSVGRWDGRTLIVESKKFTGGAYDDMGTPQSAAMQVAERFTLSEDETRLDWEATVTDPETFTEPVSRRNLHFAWVPGEEIKPFNCSVPDRE